MRKIEEALLKQSTPDVKFFPVPGGIQVMAKKRFLGLESDNPDSLKVVARFTFHTHTVSSSIHKDVINSKAAKDLVDDVILQIRTEGFSEYQ